MTLLPPAIPLKKIPIEEHSEHGIVEEKEEDANYVHNWLYSVVPISHKETGWQVNYQANENIEVSNYPLYAYLTGFCRECRKAFSAYIPSMEFRYVESQMEVPVYGCVKPGTYR